MIIKLQEPNVLLDGMAHKQHMKWPTGLIRVSNQTAMTTSLLSVTTKLKCSEEEMTVVFRRGKATRCDKSQRRGFEKTNHSYRDD